MSKSESVSNVLEGMDLLGFVSQGNARTGGHPAAKTKADMPTRTATAKFDKVKAALSAQARSPK